MGFVFIVYGIVFMFIFILFGRWCFRVIVRLGWEVGFFVFEGVFLFWFGRLFIVVVGFFFGGVGVGV